MLLIIKNIKKISRISKIKKNLKIVISIDFIYQMLYNKHFNIGDF